MASKQKELADTASDTKHDGAEKRNRRKTDTKRVASAALSQASLSSDPIKMYLREIGKVPLLSAAEEIDLARRIENGLKAANEVAEASVDDSWDSFPIKEKRRLRRLVSDGDAATDMLTSANLRLVVSIAKRYLGRGVPLLDLIQEGNVGLMRAVQKFDYEKGFKFSTYATWWIRQAITRAISDQSRTIRIPVHMSETMNRVLRTKRSLSQKLGEEPTMAELAKHVDMTEAKVSEILQLAKQDPISLDTPLGEDDDGSMADFIPDKAPAPLEQAARSLLEDSVEDVLAGLSDRESDVLRLRFGLEDGRPRTLEEVGAAFGVTRERVRQIESKTLAKLRHPLRSDRLRDYLL